MYRNASLQECDDGAAAKASLPALGYDNLHVAVRGGASFTHGWRERNFLSLLKDIWFQECEYSLVTLVWAGNDLTSPYTNPDPSHRRRDGVWKPLWRSHPSRGRGG